MCPLCCLSIDDQQDSPLEVKSKGKEGAIFKKSRDDANADGSVKRIKTEAGYTELDQRVGSYGHQAPIKQQQQEPKAQADPPPTRYLTVESIASHVAGHLRAIMLLTLRMISIDVAIEVSADNQSVSGGTDHGSSRAGSSQKGFDQESDTMEGVSLHEDSNLNPNDGLRLEEIPDIEENLNWNDVLPNSIGPKEDKFLQKVIISGAFQSHPGNGALRTIKVSSLFAE